MENIALSTTDRTVLVFIPDPASTDGSGKTGLTHASLTVSYTRVETDNDVVVTDVTSSLTTLSALTDAHADWGVKEVSSTLAPGLYRLDIADAVFATGAWYAVVYVMITSSAAAATPMKFNLVSYDPLQGGGSGLDAAGVRAAVGLASANLDTQLTTIDDYLDTELAALITTVGAAGAGLTAAGPSAAAIRTAVGLASANLDTQLSTIDTVVDAILVDTDVIGAAGAGLTSAGITAAGVRTAVGLASANVDTQLAAILARTPSASSITNMNTVFNTDFAVNYDSGIGWSVSATIDLGAGAITEEVFGTGAISARVIADNAIDQGAFNESALTAIRDATTEFENSEIVQSAPQATATIAEMVGWLYKLAICKKSNDGDDIQFYNSDGTTVDHTQEVSESSGTVTKERIAGGP